MGNFEDKYAQIMSLPHHVSDKHEQMSMIERAAQFSPFAALTGYDSSVREAARLTDRREELSEYESEYLDNRLFELEHSDGSPEIRVTVFMPDPRKDGGRYERVTGRFRRLDRYSDILYFTDGRQIKLSDISDIDVL